MDLRVYYQKIREAEKGLEDPVVVVSNETPDGGKAGVRTEVSRGLAAKMIIEGRVREANKDEARQFRDEQRAAQRAAEQLAAASRMQVTVVPSSEWANVKGGTRATKE